ncbi:MAG: type II toxin-antitoxin system PemK/MazF family toxin [Clostridia bacterium]
MQIELSKIQDLLDWIKTKIYLDTISTNSIKRVVRRGEIYKCNFGIGIGSEMQKERPCIIVQNNTRNSHSGNVIVVLISHTNKKISCIVPIETRKDEDGNTILDGYANVSNLMCVSKARLGAYITTISKEEMKKIDKELITTLDLFGYYKQFERQIKDRELYISKLKKQLSELKEITDTDSFEKYKHKNSQELFTK